MITFPIGSYFLSVDLIFGGTSCILHSSLLKDDITIHNVSNRPIHHFPKPHLSNFPFPNKHEGNSTYAGATAAIVANVVLLSYVVVAFNDDKSEREADLASGAIQPSEGRKDR